MAEAARALPAPLPVHLKLDTGMGRLGFRPEDVAEAAALLRQSGGLSLAGTFTQFASADDVRSPATEKQIREFEAALSVLRGAGVDPGLVHASNSAGALIFRRAVRRRASRPRPLRRRAFAVAVLRRERSPPSPALSLETRVMAVRRVPSGTPLGYGAAFVTERITEVAVLPIGYHDGLRRAFSWVFVVLLRGARAPVVGAVSMDLTLVDATGTGAKPGDAAVVLGRSGQEDRSSGAAGGEHQRVRDPLRDRARVRREYLP